jgi:hypothetical protein
VEPERLSQFVAGTLMQEDDNFSFRVFHDFVWKNGNVPIALQRSEYLGAAIEAEK